MRLVVTHEQERGIATTTELIAEHITVSYDPHFVTIRASNKGAVKDPFNGEEYEGLKTCTILRLGTDTVYSIKEEYNN